jgi:hypothetical protein
MHIEEKKRKNLFRRKKTIKKCFIMQLKMFWNFISVLSSDVCVISRKVLVKITGE